MKKSILVAVTIFSCSYLHAQQSNTLQNHIDSIFSGLSYDSIPTKILLDKSLSAKTAIGFAATNDSMSDFDSWYALYKAAKDGSENRGNFWQYLDFREEMKSNAKDGIIPIFILNYNYNQLKEYALDSNLIDTLDGKFVDVPSRTESPYDTKKMFSATPAFSFSSADTIQFACKQSYYFKNDTSEILSIEINFDDGLGFRTIALDEIISVHYPADGNKQIQFKITLSNSLQLFSHSFFSLKKDWEFPLDEEGYISGVIPYNPEADETDGLSCLRYSITYGKDASGVEHTTLVKPFLLLEGFDPGYPNYEPMPDDPKNGVLGWIDIVTGYKHFLPDPDDPDKNGIYEPQFDKGPEFCEMLWNNGYDIIYIDFCDGTEYIQRNAFAFIELLNFVNDTKTSNEELVIVGASMGGQIARYALSYMESNNLPHCTRLLVPFDSPAKGANFPIGVQANVYYMNELAGLAVTEFYANQIKSPAAQQLIIANYFINEVETGYSILRDELYNEIEDMGSYPQQLRKIAVINGNKNALPLAELGEGEIFMEFNASGNIGLLSLAIQTLAAFYPGASLIYGEGDLLFYGNAQMSLLLIPLDGPEGLAVVPPTEPYPHYDTSPGSVRADIGEFSDILPNIAEILDHLWILDISIDIYSETFTFVPSVSALDIYGTEDLSYDIADNLSFDDVPYPELYPFEAYYAPEATGEQHVQLTYENMAWLENQLLINETDLTSALPATVLGTLENTYNFGNAYKRKLSDVNINSGGLLQINGNYITGFGNETYDITPAAGSTFTTYTNGCGAIININNGGVLEIGDDNTPTNNKGILELLDGSKIIVKNGGTLKINKYSKLYIKSGATLEIRSGSAINVEDFGEIIVASGGLLLMKAETLNLLANNSKLSIHNGGTVQTTAGIDFTFTGDGLVFYHHEGIFDIGEGGVFRLTGSDEGDPVLWLQPDAVLEIDGNDVEITDAKILYEENS